MIMNAADQRAYLRRSVGHGADTALVSDDLLDDARAAALREVNQTFALNGVGSFDTVKDQQEYTPLPATGYGLTRVFWPQDCTFRLPREVDDVLSRFMLTEVVDEYGGRRTVEPSIVTGFYQQREFFKRLFGDGGYIVDESNVYLDPVPTTAGEKVYYLFTKQRYANSETVADIHTEPYFAAAKAFLHEALAAGRGAMTSVSSAGGVRISTVAANHHLHLAKLERDKFNSYRPPLQPGRKWS